MRTRPVLTLALLALSLSVGIAGPGLASDQATDPLGTERFEGAFQVYTGAGDVAGLYAGGLDAPEGALAPPGDADRVQVTVTWEGQDQDDAADRLGFRLCEGWCRQDRSRVLVQRDAVPPLSLEVEIPISGNLTWEAFVGQGVATDAEIRGQATYLGTTAPTSDRSPAAAEAAGGPPGQPLGIWLTLAGLSSLAALWLWVQRAGPLGVLGLYHRVDRDDLLDNETRSAIYQAIQATPGLHFSALARELDLGRRRLEHHLALLLAGDLLVEEQAYGYRCFFLPGQVPPDTRPAASVLKARGAQAVLRALIDAGGTDLQTLADRAGVAISTASHHVDRLETAGLVGSQRDGRTRRLTMTELGRRALELFDP